MSMDRRTFVASTAWTAWLMAMLGGLSPEELLGASDGGAATGAHEEFWDAFFDDVDPSKPHVALRGAEQPLPAYVDSEKTPRYFHYQDDKGLRFAENIDRSELPKFPGPALVSVSMSGFHASDSDVKKIGEVSAAQLQLHAVQTTPIAQYIAPLAWASLATVYQKKVSKLPTVDQLNFVSEDGSGTSSSVSRVLYPKGEGKFAVNVTLPPKDSILHRMLMNGMKAAQVAAPLGIAAGDQRAGDQGVHELLQHAAAECGVHHQQPVEGRGDDRSGGGFGEHARGRVEASDGPVCGGAQRVQRRLEQADGRLQDGERIPGAEDDWTRRRSAGGCAELTAGDYVCKHEDHG
jgi:hypothetical protein